MLKAGFASWTGDVIPPSNLLLIFEVITDPGVTIGEQLLEFELLLSSSMKDCLFEEGVSVSNLFFIREVTRELRSALRRGEEFLLVLGDSPSNSFFIFAVELDFMILFF